MNIFDRPGRIKAFSRTYGSDRDGWVRIREYQRVIEYAAEHPNAGSQAVVSYARPPARPHSAVIGRLEA